ncbi:MAG TPA: hypothetical protein VGI17_05580 [Solirubrobacterales bacterium]|jgi:hypothetical protein
MPHVTVDRPNVSIDEAAEALRKELGDRYEVTVDASGSRLKVSSGTLAWANVHKKDESGATGFGVHGGGIVIGRIINELTLARKVAGALKAGLAAA